MSRQNSQVMDELIAAYEAWALRMGVIPGDRLEKKISYEKYRNSPAGSDPPILLWKTEVGAQMPEVR